MMRKTGREALLDLWGQVRGTQQTLEQVLRQTRAGWQS